MRVVALADVDGYAFWPAKGYVKDALRPLATDGAVVLCDWRGAVRKSYGLKAGQSRESSVADRGEACGATPGEQLLRGCIRELYRPTATLRPCCSPHSGMSVWSFRFWQFQLSPAACR